MTTTYNPASYGAFAIDGSVDCLAAVNAMQDAMSNEHGGGIADFPNGTMYFSDDLHITVPGLFRGEGGNSSGNCTLLFPPGRGIKIDGATVSPNGRSADNAILEGFDIRSLAMIQGPAGLHQFNTARIASTAYLVGQCVAKAGASNTACFFRCTTAGTSAGGDDPAEFSTTTPGEIIVDGGVTWTAEAWPLDWQAAHVTKVGDRVFSPGSTLFYYECTAVTSDAKTGGSSPSAFGPTSFPEIDQPITDNNVTWKARTHAGILVQVVSQARDNSIFGFTTWGIHIQGGVGQAYVSGSPVNTGADFVRIGRHDIEFCGGGVYHKGDDAQGGSVTNVSCLNLGLDKAEFTTGYTKLNGTVGTGGTGFWDHSLAGNVHVNCNVQDGNGPAFIADRGVVTFVGCGDEVPAYANIVSSPAAFLSGASQGGFGTSDGLFIIAGGQGGAGLFETVATAAGSPSAGLTTGGTEPGVLWFKSRTGDLGAQRIGLFYEGNLGGVTGNAGTGWWAYRYGGQNVTGGFGISGSLASQGPGHARFWDGFVCGTESDPPYWQGLSLTALIDRRINGAHHSAGDRFRYRNSGVAGTFSEYVVKTAGYRGPQWAAKATFSSGSGYAPWGIFPATVEQATNTYPIPLSTDRCFICTATTGDEKSGTSEPAGFATANIGDFVTDNHVTWQRVAMPTYARLSVIEDFVTAIEPRTRTLWKDTADTDATTAAAKADVAKFRALGSTTSHSGNVTIFTIDSSCFNSSGDLADNAVYVVDVEVACKSPGGAAEVGSCKLSGTFYRNGGGLTRLGTDTNVPNYRAGTKNRLNISGNALQVQASPGVASTLSWVIVGQCIKKVD